MYELNGSYNCSAVEQEAGKAPLQNPRAWLKNHFRKLGLAVHEKPFPDTLESVSCVDDTVIYETMHQIQVVGACHSRLLGEMNDEWNVKMYSLIKKRVIGKS